AAVAPREGDAVRVDYDAGSGAGSFVVPPRARVGDDGWDGPEADPGRRRVGGGDRAWPSGAAGATFALRLPREGGYGAPYSPTHALDVRERGAWREVRARGAGGAVTVLLPVRRGRDASIGVLAHRPSATEDGFALVTVTPPDVRPSRTPRDVTFVIDVSGSMSGGKMAQAQ